MPWHLLLLRNKFTNFSFCLIGSFTFKIIIEKLNNRSDITAIVITVHNILHILYITAVCFAYRLDQFITVSNK